MGTGMVHETVAHTAQIKHDFCLSYQNMANGNNPFNLLRISAGPTRESLDDPVEVVGQGDV